MNKRKAIVYFFITYSVFCLLSLNRHSQTTSYNYHSELFADKAGYNVYLPSLFIYDFDATKFPKQTDIKTGSGFTLDSASGKVITKYPYGVALLESPFWLIAHALSETKDGYSSYYQKSIDFAGSFYLTLGLLFLCITINRYRSMSISIMLSALIALSTGIFYYGIFETGMSHIYSFCCFAIILYLSLNQEKTTTHFLLLGAASALYVVIRPLNSLFLIPILLFILMSEKISLRDALIKLLTLKTTLYLLLIVSVIIAPQLLYYHYAFGSFIADSYQNEPFFFPSLTRITELLFSPHNGLFIYYPILLMMLLYIIFHKNKYNKLSLFLMVSYVLIYASWWSLSLGCSFGHRAINDIALVFFIPVFMSEKKIPHFIFFVLIMCAIINLKFIFSYDTCLYTSTNWDFVEYRSILFGEFK